MRSRRIAVFALVTAALFATLIPLGILESRRTPDWQSELGRYLEISGTSTEDIRLVEGAEAQHPEQFAAQMLQAVPTGWAWQGIDRIPLPKRVRCIRIEKQAQAGWGSADQSIRQYLLVGYHSDGLWHIGWLVHEFREGVSEGEQQALLAKMGCDNWVGISARGNTPEVQETSEVLTWSYNNRFTCTRICAARILKINPAG